MKISWRRLAIAACGAAALVLGGCVTDAEKADKLGHVARDWCLTIRASQVMPAYPLSRDIEPGDVFLTTTPIGKEIALFEKNGFLPLDTHLVRLPVLGEIEKFYAKRTGDEGQFPTQVSGWDDLPAAAFPTYSFDIRRGGGLNAAFPIEGIPVGLSFLGSAAATVTVAISEAQTKGLDISTIDPLLQAWRSQHQSMLDAYANGEPGSNPVYVRVVTRVFQAKSINVHLDDASSHGASGAAGIALPAPNPGTPDATRSAGERYAELTNTLNATAGSQIGANVKFVSVSQRSVTMQEQFPKPMTIGYLAYDCLILPGGVLSAPMPTYYRVTGQSNFVPRQYNSTGLLQSWYTADSAKRVPLIKDWITKHITKDPPGFVEFASGDSWDSLRWQAMYDLGALKR
ncbi:MAG: hypothetical protein JSR77_12635 [Planctomycetes bacterium]|nr:hypothetical protein [Planctomycetota bacterium]